MTDDLALLDATDQARLVRDGEASATDLVEAAIARIEALDPQLNAVIHRTFDKARAAAAGDLPDGPFRGVPFLVKDLWQPTAGDPLHGGLQAFKDAGYTHPTDSNLVQRYREAGFVIVGRTNTPELGLVATTEPTAYGPTHNPWDLDHGAGGSSGGAAAAVAAGIVPAAHASDGGGSIRIPAAMCGLVGLKPSRGRISNGPLTDEWGLAVQHVETRTVRDSAGILDISAIPFPDDGVIAPAIGQPYATAIEAEPQPLRIGMWIDDPRVELHPECLGAVEATAAALEAAGHKVEDARPDSLDAVEDVSATFGAIWAVNARNSVRVLGAMLGRELTEDDVEPTTWAMVEISDHISGADLAAAQGAMHTFRRQTLRWWGDGWDLLLSPTTAQPPPRLGELVPSAEDPLQAARRSVPYGAFTLPWNITGQPAISLPVALTADGLPIGAQLIGAYGREDLLLQVAAQLEPAMGWVERRPPVHA